MIEEWRSIQGYEGLYSVSNLGRVKSHRSRWLVPCLLKASPNIRCDDVTDLRITLYKNKVTKRFMVHQLVLNAFVGRCPEGMECRHLDGNPENNVLTNLKWGTRAENYNDRFRHGTAYVFHPKNTSGVLGVSYNKRRKKWRAYIGAKCEDLGEFSNFSDAVNARMEAERRITATKIEVVIG